MSRKPKSAPEPETTQDTPTALPPRDEQGFELDSWGLPIVGPERVRRLAEMEMPDPVDDPDAWQHSVADSGPERAAADAPPVDATTEADNG